MNNKKRIVVAKPEYVVVADNLEPILPKGTKMILDGSTYTDEDESVIIKSTNYTGKIIKKII